MGIEMEIVADLKRWLAAGEQIALATVVWAKGSSPRPPGSRMAVTSSEQMTGSVSAGWCTDEDEARKRFAALREAGLQAILISCSPFHAERIPPVRTLRAVRAALDVFGPHENI